MKSRFERLASILALARRASVAVPQGRETPTAEPLPPGFSTRVAAVWAGSRERSEWELWDQVSRWGVVVGLVVCAVAFFLRSENALPAPSSTPFDQFVLEAPTEERS